MPTLDRGDRLLFALAAVLTVGSAVTHFAAVDAVVAFVVSAAAIALLAALVGRAVDQLSERLTPGATGVLQSALGNLPSCSSPCSPCAPGCCRSPHRP